MLDKVIFVFQRGAVDKQMVRRLGVEGVCPGCTDFNKPFVAEGGDGFRACLLIAE